jgi:hypothetical protein
MKVYEQYSFKGGKEYVQSKYPEELKEIYTAIEKLDATLCLTKLSSEKTKQGKLLFSPPALNKALKTVLCKSGWTEKDDGKKGYIEPRHKFDGNRFREMDGIKNKVGLEIQFGKYAFMGYDIFSKMVIFNKLGYINCGIEIVPVNQLCKHMSTGVADFDQLMIDFHYRGESNIDIPVLVIGIGLTDEEEMKRQKIQNRYTKDPIKFMGAVTLEKYSGSLPGPKKLLAGK